MDNLKILIVTFSQELQNGEIELFRGAFLKTMDRANVLCHNHIGDKFRYSYPLIQYKRINKKISVVALEEGIAAVSGLSPFQSFDLMIGKREEHMIVESMTANQYVVKICNDLHCYRMDRWIALNESNYLQYCQFESLAEKMLFLEKMLIGNILSFAKGIHLFFDKQVICEITDIDEPYLLYYKNVKMMAFDLKFQTNVSLPDYIGLGKGVSIGHGTIHEIHPYG